MALTSAERSALWRQRQRQNPMKHEEYKRKEKERYKKRKEKGQFLPVAELSTRNQRKLRRNWRINQRNKRQKDKKLQHDVSKILSPPNSPTSPEHHIIQQNQYESRNSAGRKKKNLNRSKVYREQFKLRIQLNNERRQKEKYKKRYFRLKKRICTDEMVSTVDKIIHKKEVRSALTLYTIMINNIKKRYRDSETSQEKRTIKNLIYREGILKRYRLCSYARGVLGVDQRYRLPIKKRGIRCTFKDDVVSFYEREDNSRVKAGKKSTITRRGMKKQVRLLNDSIKNIYRKYQFEKKVISYSLFAALKPFWIRKSTEKDRETCLCKLHENPQLKINRLQHEKILKSREVTPLIEDITCSIKTKSCMYRECSICKGKKIKTEIEPSGKMVDWFIWKSRRVDREYLNEKGETVTKKQQMTVKDKETGTIETLVSDLQVDVERIARHVFNINHQYAKLKELKENCRSSHIIIHVDFSENYMCKHREEIQSMHFGASKRQISIHTGVAYMSSKTISFASVSDCLKHGPASIWAHLKPLLKHVKEIHPELAVLHVISDGPTTQYRCRTNFYLFSTKIFEYGFKEGGSWNFLESGHGKGSPDGIGAVVKRQADELVNTYGEDITCAADLMTGLKKIGTNVLLFEVKEEHISMEEALIPATITSVPKTMQLHQVNVQLQGEVSTRILSCVCSEDKLSCVCHSPILTNFNTSAVQTRETHAELQNPLTDVLIGENAEEDANLLNIPASLDESVVNKYCVVEYDGSPYPGKIVDVDDETVEVTVMHSVGRNRFFWPMREDTLWYYRQNIITMLDEEPALVGSRHRSIKRNVWEAIVSKLNL